MDALVSLYGGMIVAMQPLNLGVLLLGLLVGVLAGALPGISFGNAVARGLPFPRLMSPLVAMAFLGGIYVGGVFGGSICSILLNIPGDPDSVPSCLDGYPLSK